MTSLKLINKDVNKLFFLFILLLLLRFVSIDKIPPAGFRDEVEKLYNGWLLKVNSGYTADNQYYPFYFNIQGSNTTGLWHYVFMFIPSSKPVSISTGRYLVALCGTLTIFLYILILQEVFQMPIFISIVCAIFFIFSPWHFLFSRWIQQGITVPLFFASFFYFWQIGIKTKRSYLFFLAGTSLGLLFYSYAVCKLLVPFILLVALIIYYEDLNFISYFYFFAGFLILGVPVIWENVFNFSTTSVRFKRISIFNTSHPFLIFLKNYMCHINPLNLFIYGDKNLRHSFPFMGMFNYFSFLPFLVGFYYLIRKKYKKYRFLLLLFFISPIAASLTNEGIPHYLRAILLLFIIQLIISLGVCKLFEWICKNGQIFFLTLYLIFIIGNLIFFFFNAFFLYPNKAKLYWDYYYFRKIIKTNFDFDKIYLNPKVVYGKYLIGYLFKIKNPEKLKELYSMDGKKIFILYSCNYLNSLPFYLKKNLTSCLRNSEFISMTISNKEIILSPIYTIIVENNNNKFF